MTLLRWQGRERYVVLDTAFADGQRFIAAWEAWRRDPGRSQRLVYLAVARKGLAAGDLEAAESARSSGPAWPLSGASDEGLRGNASESASQLIETWPPPTPDLHRLAFDNARVELLIGFGEPRVWLREFVAEVDEFFVDAAQLESIGRGSIVAALKSFARLAAPLARLTVSNPGTALSSSLLVALPSVGFVLEGGSPPLTSDDGPGLGVASPLLTVYQPSFTPKRPLGRTASAPASLASQHRTASARHALIIGGGLAGCSAALALAEQGWTSTIIDRQPTLAAETSGNAGGLFHGIFNAQDGLHARFNRAASLEAAKAVRIAIAAHGPAGQVDGLLRLETSLPSSRDMQRLLDALQLPPAYVEAVDASEASRRSGLPITSPAWWYARGGWVDPAALCRSFVARAEAMVGPLQLITSAVVERIERNASTKRWAVLDADNQVIAEADVVVLANAGGVEALLRRSFPHQPETSFLGVAMAKVRGQISAVDADTPTLRLARVPVAGAGYVLPPSHGMVLTGASSQDGDDEPSLRLADHAHNLAQMNALTGSAIDTDHTPLQGRVGWRCVVPDRLPLIGALPSLDLYAGQHRLDQPRLVPREPGLYVYTALGSRGITWSALGARILASWITSAPFPVEASLIDALDAARFVSRAARK